MRAKLMIAVLLLATLSGCEKDMDAKAAWNDVIKRCATTSLNGKEILFFGPSNAVGAGSVWRKDQGGVFRLRFDLSQMPEPKNFTAPSAPSTCDGTSSKNFKGGFNVSLDSNGVAASAKSDFAKAKSVSAKATAIAWVPVAERPYEDYINGLAEGVSLKEEMTKDGRYILTRALKISGFSTTMTFSRDVAASLEAKYPNGPLPAGLLGSIGAGATGQWSSEGSLTITSGADFYIAGEFQQYKPDGFASASPSVFGPKLTLEPNAKAERAP